jgi:hypothetical protein
LDLAERLLKKVSFSLGGFHFTTDGFRKNDDQRDDIANAFVQLELSPQTSLQAEYRYRNTEKGFLQPAIVQPSPSIHFRG